MSKEKNGRSRSGKPKYLYLDKFNRYKTITDTMLQNSEEDQMVNTRQIQVVKKKMSNQIRTLRILIGINAVIGLTALILSLL